MSKESDDNVGQKLSWGNRDWIWLTGTLGFLMVVTLAHWFMRVNGDILGHITLMSAGVSIVLALVAIGISITQNLQSNTLNGKMMGTIERVDEKLMSIKDNLDVTASQRNRPQDDKDNKGKTMTRYHGYITTNKPINNDEFINDMDAILKELNPLAKIIQYSIFDSIRISGYRRTYLTNLLLVVEEDMDKRSLEDVTRLALNRQCIDDIGFNMYDGKL